MKDEEKRFYFIEANIVGMSLDDVGTPWATQLQCENVSILSNLFSFSLSQHRNKLVRFPHLALPA
jgi:hypothetical protein